MAEKKSLGKELTKGIIAENPVLRLVLGTCPTLATTTSVESAIGMGLAASVVLICSNVVISALRKVIPDKVRIPAYIVIIASFVTIVQMIVKAFLPSLDEQLGVYLPLMAVNSLVALHCERVAVKRTIKESLVDALSASISYGTVAILVGVIREILANGTIMGINLNMPVHFSALSMPFGALLILGFMAAVLKAFINKKYPT